jgi:hypothetical protein
MKAAGGLCYGLAALSCLAALASVIVGADWIEQLSGASPDGGDGSLELAWVIVPLVLAVASGVAGRRLRARGARRGPAADLGHRTPS